MAPFSFAWYVMTVEIIRTVLLLLLVPNCTIVLSKVRICAVLLTLYSRTVRTFNQSFPSNLVLVGWPATAQDCAQLGEQGGEISGYW